MFTRPMTVPRALAWSLAALCAGCAAGEDVWSEAPTEFPLAYFHDDCAPWDGPALSIVLGHEQLADPFDARYPSVRITSFRPPPVIDGGTFGWSGPSHDLGHAEWCESADACRAATAVRVRFDELQPQADELRGQLHLEFEDGQTVSGAFRAGRLPIRMLCG